MKQTQKFDPVNSWLDMVYFSKSRSEDTLKNYKRHLQSFLDFIGKTGQEILQEYKGSKDRVFKRKYARLVKVWVAHLGKKKGLNNNSIGTYLHGVESFFKYNDLPLGFVPELRQIVTYHNRDITKEEIAHVLGVSRPRDRAFFLVMLTSGLRPYTLKRLKIKHLEPDLSDGKIPCSIGVPQKLAKGKYQQHWTFITGEAVEALKDYLKTRPHMTKESPLFAKLGTEEPIRSKTLSGVFNRLIRRLKKKGVLDFKAPEGKPAQLRLYCLRKFFSKQAGVVPEYKEFWMGHTDAVREAYLSKDIEHHRQVYREKVAGRLRIKEKTLDETVIEEQQEKIGRLEETVNKLKAQQQSRIRKLEEAVTALQIQILKHGAKGGDDRTGQKLADQQTKIMYELVKEQDPELYKKWVKGFLRRGEDFGVKPEHVEKALIDDFGVKPEYLKKIKEDAET